MEWRYERGPQRFVWLAEMQVLVNLDQIVTVELARGKAFITMTRTAGEHQYITVESAYDLHSLREAVGLEVKK